MAASERMSYGLMHREALALKLALTYHQTTEQAALEAGVSLEGLTEKWLPVAEMAIHEILE